MNKPDDVTQNAWDAALHSLESAWADHDRVFNHASNSISEGLFCRFIESTSRAIMAAKVQEREACLKIACDWQESHDYDASIGIADSIRARKP